MSYIGIDVGGSKIFAERFESGKVKKQIKLIVGRKPIDELVSIISSLITPGLKGIGIGVPGFVSNRTTFGFTNLKGFEKKNVKAMLEKRFCVDVRIDNDANLFALAEQKLGVAKGKGIVVGITLGTGVGSGIVIDGTIFHGSNDRGAELGHMCIERNGLPCGCGSRGCLEAYCSSKALMETYRMKTGKLCSPIEISRLAIAGNSFAAKSCIEYGRNLGIGLANISNIFHPDAIVIGGGLSNIKMIYKPAIAEMRKRAMSYLKDVAVVKSKLGENAIPLGAVLQFDDAIRN